MKKTLQKTTEWFRKTTPPEIVQEVCSSRDIFQGRLDHMLRKLSQKTKKETESALFTAVIGELGNNCFDHNLGQWKDISGCQFQYGCDAENIW